MKYTREMLVEAVKASKSIAGVLRYLGIRQSGGAQAHIGRRIKQLGIDTSHFTGQVHNKGRPARNRLPWQDVLVVRPDGSPRAKTEMLRRALLENGRPYVCEECGNSGEGNDLPLTLHVDHIDGNSHDCRPENLRFLCANCHSQTATWAGANKKRKKQTPYEKFQHCGRAHSPNDVLLTIRKGSLTTFDFPITHTTR